MGVCHKVHKGLKEVSLLTEKSEVGVSIEVRSEAVKQKCSFIMSPSLKIVCEPKTRTIRYNFNSTLQSRCGDIFSKINDCIYRLVYPKDDLLEECFGASEKTELAIKGEISTLMRGVREQLNDASSHFLGLLNPQLVSGVRKFDPYIRYQLYREFQRDKTGRLIQMADVCPGLLMLGLFFKGMRGLGEEKSKLGSALLKSIKDGKKLGPLIDDCVDAVIKWRCALSDLEPVPVPFILRRIKMGDERVLKETKRKARILIAKAGKQVHPAQLSRLPALAFSAEDIPQSPAKNRYWYDLVMGTFLMTPSPNEHEDRFRTGFSAFISKNILMLFKLCRHGRRSRDLIRDIQDYLKAVGRTPCRKTDLKKLMQESKKWHEEMANQREAVNLNSLQAKFGEDVMDFQLPRPLQDWREGEDAIIAIRTPRDLVNEGYKMKNCLGGMVNEALTGASLFFSATILGKSLSIQVSKRGEYIQLEQVRSKANGTATREQLVIVNQWLVSQRKVLFERIYEET